MKHEPQHATSPTWCVHCGMFDCYFTGDGECDAPREGRFDARQAANWERMFAGIFGQPKPDGVEELIWFALTPQQREGHALVRGLENARRARLAWEKAKGGDE